MEQQQQPPGPQRGTHGRQENPEELSPAGPVVSKPNSVSDDLAPKQEPKFVELHQTPTHYRCEAIQRIVQNSELPRTWAGLNLVVLLRKEVIQPHLPVRLPCYDFVPIADPTFDGSLHKG